MVVPPAMFARPMPGSRGRQEQSPEPTFVSVSAADARPPTTKRATPHGVHVEVQASTPAVCPVVNGVVQNVQQLGEVDDLLASDDDTGPTVIRGGAARA